MTISAWVTVSIVWLIVTYFTVRFLVKVVRTPSRDDEQDGSS
jgi:hypothetical protein